MDLIDESVGAHGRRVRKMYVLHDVPTEIKACGHVNLTCMIGRVVTARELDAQKGYIGAYGHVR